MCGIVAGAFQDNVIPFLLYGLKQEEYRGYDACGIGFLEKKEIQIVKKIGRINSLVEKVQNLKGNIGIAHTRWATHGKNTENNAHPHMSMHRIFALVHNGTIYNYKEIRTSLMQKGYVFYSQTDTECLANLLEYEYALSGNILEAMQQMQQRVKGTYALCILNKEEERIYFMKKSAPLIIGIGKQGISLSSDIRALEKQDFSVNLDEEEYGYITKENYFIYNQNQRVTKKEKPIQKNRFQKKEISMDCYMKKEIFEIPYILENILKKYENGFSAEIINLFSQASKIVFIASGTSYHAALIGSQYFSIPTEIYFSSEFITEERKIHSDVLYVFLSQSGETMDVLKALEFVLSHKGITLGIANVENSTLLRKTQYSLQMHAEAEVAVASTKAYCAEVLLLYLLAKYDKISFCKENILLIIREIKEHLKNVESIENIAEQLKEKEHAYFLAKGKDYFLIQEASLKIKEVTYLHSETLYAGELKHGPIALIDEGFPVFLLGNKENNEALLSAREEVEARGAVTYFMTYDAKQDLGFLPLMTDFFLLAFYLAQKKGCDVDKPRNLAKSVTVE